MINITLILKSKNIVVKRLGFQVRLIGFEFHFTC